MIRDIKWAYELGFKRGWKVGHRRGRKAAEPLIQRYHNKGCENHGGYKGAYMTFCPECGIEL
jgi:hypothetical protein